MPTLYSTLELPTCFVPNLTSTLSGHTAGRGRQPCLRDEPQLSSRESPCIALRANGRVHVFVVLDIVDVALQVGVLRESAA